MRALPFDSLQTSNFVTLLLCFPPCIGWKSQAGLTKLESWQTSLWQYWQMVKGGNYSQTEALRKKVMQIPYPVKCEV